MGLNFKKISAEQIVTNPDKRFITEEELILVNNSLQKNENLKDLGDIVQARINLELDNLAQPITSVAGRIGDIVLNLSDIQDILVSSTQVNEISSLDISRLRELIRDALIESNISTAMIINGNIINLPISIKSIINVFIQGEGILIGGYKHTRNSSKILLDNSSLNGKQAIVTYFI